MGTVISSLAKLSARITNSPPKRGPYRQAKWVTALVVGISALWALATQAQTPYRPAWLVATGALAAGAEVTRDSLRAETTGVNGTFVLTAARLPSATIEDTVFVKELDAVKHAMDAYNPISIIEDREYIGAVYRLNNGQGYLYSVAPGEIGRDQVSASIPKLTNAKFVAFWHTHGAHHWNREFFSDTDTQLVKQWGLPFYLGCADGQLRVFRPNHKTLSFRQAQSEGLGRQLGFGRGELIRDVNIRVN